MHPTGRLRLGEQDLVRQLQLHRWPACHSLCFDTRGIYEAVHIPEAQLEQIRQAGRSLPLLQCLHIISSRYNTVKVGCSVQALLLEILAKHVIVLTLEVRFLGVHLELPNLQHLVLHILQNVAEKDYGSLFPTMGSLINLKTIYVQSDRRFSKMRGPLNLRGWAQLQHVALRNVYIEGALDLPAGCLLHAFGTPCNGSIISSTLVDRVTGLTLRPDEDRILNLSHGEPLLRWALVMRQLKLLRLTLRKDPFEVLKKFSPWRQLLIDVSYGTAPFLEDLELDVQCNLRVTIHPMLPLRSIIIVTAGHLVLRRSDSPCQAPGDILQQLYIQSGALVRPACKDWLKKSDRTELWAQIKRYGGEQGGWTLQMPASFTPRNLQECCCNACPECLGRAGAPILCDRAWTSKGFDKHMRPMAI